MSTNIYLHISKLSQKLIGIQETYIKVEHYILTRWTT